MIPGLNDPDALALSGDKLYVTTGGVVGTDDAISGFPDNPDLITGLSNPEGIAVSGGRPVFWKTRNLWTGAFVS